MKMGNFSDYLSEDDDDKKELSYYADSLSPVMTSRLSKVDKSLTNH